jgi:hypothetical protein
VLTHVASRRAHSPPQLGKKQLAGKRCRLTAGPSKEDLSKVSAAVSIDVENSFANAEAVQQACGWEVIKGYAVYELEDALGTFVAHKRWWNQKPTGVWVDVTPRVASATTELVLLESALGAKTPIKMSDAVREGAKARLAMGGFAIGVPPSDRLPPAPLPASSPVATKPKPKPPPTPPKLEFKGSESLEELVQLLTKGSSHAQVRAAAALAAQAATGPTESQRIVSAGGLQPLLLLLRREGEVQEHAARAIMSLADCMEHQKQITVAGAIPAVVQLLQGATPAVQDTAAGILGNLAIQNPANQAAIVAAGALPPLVNLLLKGSSPAKEQACFALWNLACQHPDNQLAIEQAAAIKPLVALLSKGSAALQEEAAGALMNLAAHPDNKRAIAGAEAIAPLVEMLKAGGGPAEQAAGCLMNLASNNAENQRLILKASALPPLLTLLKDKGGSSRRAREYVAGALMNLALKQPATQAEIAKGGAIPLLVEMLGDKEGLMEEVAGALTNLADTNEDNQEAIGKAGAVAPLIKLLGSGVPKSGQEEAAGTLMNLAASEANKAKMVSAGVLGPFLALLSTGTVAMQEHVLRLPGQPGKRARRAPDGDHQGGRDRAAAQLAERHGRRRAGRSTRRRRAGFLGAPPPLPSQGRRGRGHARGRRRQAHYSARARRLGGGWRAHEPRASLGGRAAGHPDGRRAPFARGDALGGHPCGPGGGRGRHHEPGHQRAAQPEACGRRGRGAPPRDAPLLWRHAHRQGAGRCGPRKPRARQRAAAKGHRRRAGMPTTRRDAQGRARRRRRLGQGRQEARHADGQDDGRRTRRGVQLPAHPSRGRRAVTSGARRGGHPAARGGAPQAQGECGGGHAPPRRL